MRLTSFTDYSLRVLIYVAAQPEGRATIAEVARTYDISENHLTKVVHFLGKAGFLTNVRGRGGGLELSRPAREINVGAVVRHTEGAAVPAACFEADNDTCNIVKVCKLRGVLEEAVQAFYGVLDKYTLDDLVHNRRTLNRILFPHFRSKATTS
jgi:Rrf2 family nitric oxide-sensitive transcriptional repressor